MLRRVDNASVRLVRGWGKKGRVSFTVGRSGARFEQKMTQAEFDTLMASSDRQPLPFQLDGFTYWRFQGRWYKDNDGLDVDQVYALLVTKLQREAARINRAQAMVAMAQAPVPPKRTQLPEDVRQFVWMRDRGQCQGCGSNQELQFDHIIPVAFGGASTVENLQLLCGPCNRRKGAGLK